MMMIIKEGILQRIEELVCIDQHILKTSILRRKKNLLMAWITHREVYCMVLQRMIIDSLTVYNISNKVIKFIEKIIENWKVKQTAGSKKLS